MKTKTESTYTTSSEIKYMPMENLRIAISLANGNSPAMPMKKRLAQIALLLNRLIPMINDYEKLTSFHAVNSHEALVRFENRIRFLRGAIGGALIANKRDSTLQAFDEALDEVAEGSI